MTGVRSALDSVNGMRFSAAYGGPEVEAGRMSAKLLAPALFGIAELVERSATVAYGKPNALTVEVDANFKRGSFEFDLVAAVVVGQQILSTLSIEEIDVLLRWIGLIGDEAGSLFRFLRRVGGKRIERVETTGDGEVHVTVNGDHNHIVISPAVFKLATDPGVRTASTSIVEPLEAAGITEFRSGATKSARELVLRPDDVPAIKAALDLETNLTDSVSESAVEVIAPSFQNGNKWRVAQGGATFWLGISDPAFLARIESGESFAKGDYLIGDIRQRVFSTLSGGLEVEREIVRVREHRRRDQQGNLFSIN